MINDFVEVQIRYPYGNERIYPMNRLAVLFTKLTGTRTLSHEDLGIIAKLGFEIRFIAETAGMMGAASGDE